MQTLKELQQGWEWKGNKWIKTGKRQKHKPPKRKNKNKNKQTVKTRIDYNENIQVALSHIKKQHQIYIDKRKDADMSLGENKVAEFLMRNEIRFISEYYFDDLSVNGNFKILFFDFYLPEYNMVIEYDGKQHYTGKFDGVDIPNIKRNDFIKTIYCKRKGIKILRIKYTQYARVEEIICSYFDKHF